MSKQSLTDLEKFEMLFGHDGKRTPSGIEYRVQNLDRSRYEAQTLIQKKGFSLQAGCEGSMASIRTFIVKEVNHGK